MSGPTNPATPLPPPPAVSSLIGLATLAYECRQAQQAYFRSKSAKALKLAKRYEAELDVMVGDILRCAGVDNPTQRQRPLL